MLRNNSNDYLNLLAVYHIIVNISTTHTLLLGFLVCAQCNGRFGFLGPRTKRQIGIK